MCNDLGTAATITRLALLNAARSLEIAQTSHDKEDILIAEIHIMLLEDTLRNWPFLCGRHGIDVYTGITSRFLDWLK